MMSQPKNYIVVDDDSTNNLICDFTIGKFDKNACIDLFTDPEVALQFIGTKYAQTSNLIPTVLFLDVNMPAMSGFEFLDEFRKFNVEIQQQFTIYMLSSSIEDFNSSSKKYPLVTAFLSKPLKFSTLKKIFEP